MHSLTSDENPWGTPSKVYFSDKPLLEGCTDLQSVDWNELDLNVEVPDVSLVDAIVEESVNNAQFVADPLSHSITMEITVKPGQIREFRKVLRTHKLPRKLKKYIKKHYFDEYPKRVNAFMLRVAFAVNNPAKAGKVGLYIGVDIAKGEENERD